MSGVIFLLADDGSLLEMQEQPYAGEDLLQELLASHPRLLSGDRELGGGGGWLLISRETGVPSEPAGSNRWSVDHLFLDREGIPTLVEVKRSSDTRIRRKVIGQMLDYAANAVVYWPIEEIQAAFDETCRRESLDPDTRLAEFLGEDDPDEFWLRAKTNLQAGRIRLVFVADIIPSELERIVEFLNEQMDPAEVLAVEVRQFVGQGSRTLVPKLVGRTAEAERRKSPGGRRQRQWDEATFLEELSEASPEDVPVARAMLDWAERKALRVWWGKGKITGSLYPIVERDKEWYSLVGFWTSGIGQVQFGQLKSRAPFTDLERRREFAGRLSQVPGIDLGEEMLDRYPSFDLRVLREASAQQRFFEALDWAVEQVRSAPTDELK